MKLSEGGLIILVIVVTIALIGGAFAGYIWYHHTPVEAIVEKTPKKETKIDLDLSLSSPEIKPQKRSKKKPPVPLEKSYLSLS